MVSGAPCRTWWVWSRELLGPSGERPGGAAGQVLIILHYVNFDLA